MSDPRTTSVFLALFLLTVILGFVASRQRQGALDELHEWGLGGRRFGTLITWFLLGGDLYTAYTFIAVPALMYSVGAMGFFAVPYTILAYPLALPFLPRLWDICKRNGYITLADFVHHRHGSHALELAVAVTGILAVMPYIALQLLGMQVVITALGFTGTGFTANLPLLLAFVALASYTYAGGLRASAMIAIVKDVLIFLTIIVAVVVIPSKLGGFAHIFSVAQSTLAARPKPGSIIMSPAGFSAYASLAFGSALTLFFYPHTITGVLSSKSADTVRRNTALLPAYSFLLALIALLGYMAITAGVGTAAPNLTVPLLFKALLPPWFVGVAYAAIAIGALVPAAIMSIAAANLVTRNIHGRYFHSGATNGEESRVAKIASLFVKTGALAFVLYLPTKYAVNLQLLGGIWILQTLPAVAFGLYRCWFHERALLVGWFTGMAAGTTMFVSQGFSPISPLHIGGTTFGCYTALLAMVVNLAFATFSTLLLDCVRIPRRGKPEILTIEPRRNGDLAARAFPRSTNLFEEHDAFLNA